MVTATSVRVGDGNKLVTGGPVAVTREERGGYFLIDAKDLDEAIAMTAHIREVHKATLDSRPVMEMAGLPD